MLPTAREPPPSEEATVISDRESEKGEKVIDAAPVPLLDDEPPEGGLRAWLTVIGHCMVLFSMFGLSNAFGVLQAHFEADLLRDYSKSSISWIGTTNLALLYSMSLPMGRLFDQGWYSTQLRVGSVAYIVGVFTLSVSKEYYQFFLSYGVLMGLGVGASFGPTVACVGTYFRRKRGMVIGLGAGVSAAGSVMFPILLNRLLPRIGFPQTIRAVGYILIGMLAMANVLTRPRQLPPKVQPPVLPLIASFLREPATWCACLGAWGMMCGFYFVPFSIQTYAQSHGAGLELGDYALSILNAASVFGRFVPGLILDKVGVWNTTVPFVLCTGALIFAMLGATSTAGMVVFLIAYGFVSAAFITLMTPLFMSLAHGVHELGTRTGLGFVFIACASLVGAPVGGALVKVTGGQYWAACVWAGGITIVGGCLIAVGRQLRAGQKGTWKV